MVIAHIFRRIMPDDLLAQPRASEAILGDPTLLDRPALGLF